MSSRMARTAQAVNSSYARTAINQRSCIRNTNVVRQSKIKYYLPITNDPVCAELLEPIMFRATPWKRCSKKGERPANRQREFVASPSRRCAGIGWSLVVCLHQNFKVLALDSPLSANSSNRSICDWRSQCRNMPKFMEQDFTRLSSRSHLQWFLGCVSKSVSKRNASECWQRQWSDQSYGTLELHLATKVSQICP